MGTIALAGQYIRKSSPKNLLEMEVRSIITVFKVGLAVAAVALMGVLACSESDNGQPERASENEQLVRAPENEQPIREAEKSNLTWQEFDRWEGQGNYATPPFHISGSEWRIDWLAEPDANSGGNLSIQLYTGNGVFLQELFNTELQEEATLKEQLQGAIGVTGPGDFLLRIITSRSFEVTVQEFR